LKKPSDATISWTTESGTGASVVTTDAPVPDSVVQEIVASDGFFNGWSIDLSGAAY